MIALSLAWLLVAQWTAFGRSPDPSVMLDGYWQSCADDEGYAERIYDAKNGFELHMGPRDEFAIFVGIQDAHREHSDISNLLGPSYAVHDAATWRGKKSWTVPSLHLRLTATEAGGSRDSCDSFVVRLERTR